MEAQVNGGRKHVNSSCRLHMTIFTVIFNLKMNTHTGRCIYIQIDIRKQKLLIPKLGLAREESEQFVRKLRRCDS
jgi:hypothetical protein